MGDASEGPWASGFPPYWTEFLDRHALRGAKVEIPGDADLSGMGGDLQLMDEAQAREEAEDGYPGIVVRADGFVPVGMCLAGSGDPYFIRIGDGAGGPLYRVYHDALVPEGEGYRCDADAVATVLASYEAMLRYRAE